MKWYRVSIWILALLVLSACGYPAQQRLQTSDLPVHIAQVQSAVEAYQQQNKLLPYLYKDEERKLTTKYLVDLKALSGYGAEIPLTSFEKGGTYIYVLTNVEKKPLVRVYDLRVGDEISKLEGAIRTYQKENKKLPAKAKEGPYQQIDFEAMNMNSVLIPSPYHVGEGLPVLMDHEGRVFVDYRTDLARYLQEKPDKPLPGEDLRVWLARVGLFVPAYSPLMELDKNQIPQLLPYREM
ncbi:hypothetical protein [Risungbinella massiliensis]|uniref:hypothetical protein n=1 Tax=Risungbinella massiliensis TaxID=1329796 RepID=UPI0005CC2146|nr:hypothetical protein [Risungbinella massiliensis]